MRRILALSLVSILLFTNTLSQAGLGAVLTATPALGGARIPPASIGYLAERYQANPDRKVILIQDLHAHLDTQRKIIELLKFYESQGPQQRPVAIEGTSGPWDLSLLESFPAQARRTEFFNYLLEEAGLTGPEWYALATHRPQLLYGIDSLPDYSTQRQLFQETRTAREIAATQIDTVQESLTALCESRFSGKLKKWKSLTDQFDQGKLYGDQYLKELVALSSGVHLPAEASALKVALTAQSTHELANLATSDRFYSELRKYGQSVGLAVSRTTGDAHLVNAVYAADLIKRLLRQQLTLEEIRQIASRQEAVAQLTVEMIQHSGQATWFNLTGLLELIRSATDFYVAALVRDAPMAQYTVALLGPTSATLSPVRSRRMASLLRTTGREGQQAGSNVGAPSTVVLVVGGFHTLGITRELKRLGVSYDVITPNITADFTPEDEARYADRLTGIPVNLDGMKSRLATTASDSPANIASPQVHSLTALLPPLKKFINT